MLSCASCDQPTDSKFTWPDGKFAPCCKACFESGDFDKWLEIGNRALQGCNIAIESSGNIADDRKGLLAAMRSEARMEDGVCPNGCALMIQLDAHTRECPACKFVGWQNTPIDKSMLL